MRGHLDGGGSHGRSIPNPASILSILENCHDSIFITFNMTCTNSQTKMQKSNQEPNQTKKITCSSSWLFSILNLLDLLDMVMGILAAQVKQGPCIGSSCSAIRLLVWSNRTSCFDQGWGRTEQKLGLKSDSDLQIELTCICQNSQHIYQFMIFIFVGIIFTSACIQFSETMYSGINARECS